MARTIEQIATSVMRKFGRLPEGQTITGGQKTQVKDEYDELYLELKDISLVSWGADDDVPTEAAGPIKVLLLGRLADDFGVPNKWDNEVVIKNQKMRLGALMATPWEYQETQFPNV